MVTPVKNVLLLAFSLLVAFSVAEILLRIFLPAPVIWKYPQERYVFDPEIGHRLAANQTAYTHNKPVSINSKGIRDVEYSHQIDSSAYRILAIGDSQTFGNGLVQADTWPKQLENALNQTNRKIKFEVLNCGLPASDTWQHQIILERMLKNYEASAVVLAFYVNDVVARPESISIEKSSNKSELEYRIIYFFKQSALLLGIRTAYGALKQLIKPDEWNTTQNMIIQGKSGPAIDARWLQVEQSLKVMKEIANENNTTFLIVSIPRRDQVDGSYQAKRYNQRLESIASKVGIPVINVLEPLKESYKKYGKDLFIPWDGHNSGVANRVIAQEITRALPGILPFDDSIIIQAD